MSETGRACLYPTEIDEALKVALVSIAPAEQCSPAYQIVELRNVSGAELGDVRFTFAPSSASDRFAFASDVFEVSTDDGATWSRIGEPIGAGTEEDPLIWSRAEAPSLARLGAAGDPDDSVLFRWRSVFGEGVRSEARLWLGADAADACGVRADTPVRPIRLPLLRAELLARLEGRNASRNGDFGPTVAAAPGDEVEWRVEVENIGEALAREVRAQFTDGDQPIAALTSQTDGALLNRGVLELANLVENGRRTALLRETVGPGCQRRVTRVEPSWGCAPAPAGRGSGLRNPFGGAAVATLDTAADPDAVIISQNLSALDGGETIGDLAEVRLTIGAEGPPMFEPEATAVLPDGYVLDETFPVALLTATARIRGVSVDAERPETPRFRLLGATGEAAHLNQGESAQLTFRIARARSSPLERDALSTTVAFRDACSQLKQSRAQRLETEFRQPLLRVSAGPEGDAIVGATAPRRFRVEITNDGSETARDLMLELTLGPGWAGVSDTGDGALCAPVAGEERSYRCPLGVSLDPGDAVTAPLELAPAEEAGALDVSVAAASFGRRADGPPPERPIERWTASTGGVGFSLRQVLRNRVGAGRDPEEPLDLGELVAVDIEARWFGVGEASVDNAAVIQRLPPGFGLRRIEDLGGDLELDTAIGPAVGQSGQVLWSLKDFTGSGVFNGRLHLEVIDSGAAEAVEEGAEPVTLTPGTVDADAVFTLRGVSYGVDPLGDSPTRADPLRLKFRRPDIRLDFALEQRAPQGASPDGGEGAYVVGGGDRLIGVVRLRNLGGAPGYLDWVNFEAQAPFSIEPFDEDQLDNDFDGSIDEPDEASIVIADLDGDAPSLRWIALRDAASATVTGSAQRVDPGFDASWRFALQVSPEVAPDTETALRLDGQFDGAPFSQDADGERQRISLRPIVRTPPIRSVLVLAGTSFGSDLSARVRHGEQVDHRLSVRFPPSAMEDLAIEIALPPALRGVRVDSARLAGGMICDAIGEPTVRASSDGDESRRTLVWSLGRCVAVNSGVETDRMAILDFTGTVEDADPAVSAAARADWRMAELAAEISFEDAAFAADAAAAGPHQEGARRRAAAGRSALVLHGGALLAQIERSGDAAERVDAGDRFEAVVRLSNVGDGPLTAPYALLRAPQTGGIDCVSVRFSGRGAAFQAAPEAAAAAPGAERLCGPGAHAPALTLEPGGSIDLAMTGRLALAAPVAARISPMLEVGASGPEGRPLRAGDAPFALESAAPSPPELRVALAEPGAAGQEAAPAPVVGDADAVQLTPPAAIGDVFRVAAAYPLPEGRADAELELRFRLSGQTGVAAAWGDAAPIELLAAVLGRDRADMRSEADPGGVNATPPGDRAEALRSVTLESDADGWLSLRIPLGEVGFADPGPSPGEGAYRLEAVVALADAPAAISKRVLQVDAATLIGERRFAVGAVDAARIVEPFVEVAALNTDLDGVVRPGDRFEFHAVACNRGASPAFGVALEGALPAAVAPDPNAPPRYEMLVEGSALAPPLFGEARIVGERVTATPAGPASALAPGACLRLRAPVVARAAAPVDDDAVARFAAARYLARPSEGRPGRVYRGASASETRVFGAAIALGAPAAIEVSPGGEALYPFTARVAGTRPTPLTVRIDGAPELDWVIHLDRNGDGALDDGDGVWRDGDPARGGETVAFLARAKIPADAPVGWRRTAVLRALAITSEGARLSGVRELALQRASDRAGAMTARRLMAVDRDCDGSLENERTQDAVFEPVKEAAPGECVVMRIAFANEGGVAVENVVVADALPQGVRLLDGSPRFLETPSGLVGGVVERSERDELRFDFVGFLAPGQNGEVEYRVRVEDG